MKRVRSSGLPSRSSTSRHFGPAGQVRDGNQAAQRAVAEPKAGGLAAFERGLGEEAFLRERLRELAQTIPGLRQTFHATREASSLGGGTRRPGRSSAPPGGRPVEKVAGELGQYLALAPWEERFAAEALNRYKTCGRPGPRRRTPDRSIRPVGGQGVEMASHRLTGHLHPGLELGQRGLTAALDELEQVFAGSRRARGRGDRFTGTPYLPPCPIVKVIL